jgi:hypothetical protein
MSFYSDASLVMIPSGYKDQKVYCAVPTDGLGDLTFSRASSATRVASNGLIEKVRTNEILYSQDFSNAEWSAAAGITLTHGQTDPNGGTTATKVEFSASGEAFEQEIGGLSTSTIYTFSVWVRCDSGTISFEMGNLNALSFETKTATTTWQRFSVTQTPSATTRYPRFVQGTAASTLYIAFAQLEVSDFGATDYIATTTAAVSVGPVSGLPRLDYLGSTCPRLLLEPQRTNLVTFSEQFDNAAWTKSGSATIISANSSTSPSGYQDADTWTINSAGARYVSQTKTVTAGAVTASFFVKKLTSDWFYLNIVDGATNAGYTFNVANGTLGQSISTALTPTPSIVDYGNGWYRCSVTATVVGISIEARGYVATSSSTVSAAIGLSLICWGAQLEEGAYATSYIPTLGAAITRVADAALKTSATALIGQTEGTIFFECSNKGLFVGARYFGVSDGTSSNRIDIYQADATNLGIFVGAGGVAQVNVTNVALPASGAFKFALAYANNDYVWYVNGTQVGTDTSASVPATSAALLGVAADLTASAGNSPFSQALLFKTRLTNDQLASLTSL